MNNVIVAQFELLANRYEFVIVDPNELGCHTSHTFGSSRRKRLCYPEKI
jgi:hypothetical protein